MKLNLGSGSLTNTGNGWVNIDLVNENGKVDKVWDLNTPLDYPKESVEQIVALHVIEHLHHPTIGDVVRNWYEILEKGGTIIIETPDFDGLIRILAEEPNNQTALEWVFGSQDRQGQSHHWGYNIHRLRELFIKAGFAPENIVFPQAEDYHSKIMPCLRLEAQK